MQKTEVLTFFFTLVCAEVNHEMLNILKYVRPGGGFVPKFPVFSKVEVNGLNEDPLFTFLKVHYVLLKAERYKFTEWIYYPYSLFFSYQRCRCLTLKNSDTMSFPVSPQESLPFVNPVIGDIKKFYWSPIKVNDIRWNFEKFLITANGMPFKR